jgi:glycosyltransferase involved in cell wall biosynthesis
MRIAINARFAGLSQAEGYAHYTRGLVECMAELCPDDEFIMMYDRPRQSSAMRGSNITEKYAGPAARHPILWKSWYDVSMPLMARKAKADVIFSPDGFCSLTTSIPQVLAIHDLSFLHFPDGISPLYRAYYRYFTPKFIRKAKHIVTVSEFSKADIVKHYPQAAGKISVIYNDAVQGFAQVDWKIREQIKEQFTGGMEYFLYTGAIHPRKNLVNLLKGFSWFKKRHQSNMKLVLAGRMAWKNDAFLQLLSTYKYRDDVLMTGYVEQEDMFRLTAGAYAALYPSWWEGFGLPVLEAMRSGIPVITSAHSAMEEVGDNAAIYVEPGDPEAWGRAMGLVFKDEAYRNVYVDRGLERAAMFSWKRSAWQLKEVFSAL